LPKTLAPSIPPNNPPELPPIVAQPVSKATAIAIAKNFFFIFSLFIWVIN
jgi:hypothetical protein